MDRALLERHLGHIRDSVALLRERGRIDRLAADPVPVVPRIVAGRDDSRSEGPQLVERQGPAWSPRERRRCNRFGCGPGRDVQFGFVVHTLQSAIQAAIDADSGIDEAEPDVAFAGTLYVVVWSEQSATQPNEYRIPVIQRVPGATSACGLRYVTGRTPTVDNAKPVVCTQFTGGVSRDLAVLCWEHGDLNNGNSLVMRRRFDSFGGGAIVTTSPGCQGEGTAGTQGPLAIGNPRFELTLTGADPNAPITVMALGLVASPSQGGSCWFVNALATVSAPITSGAARFPLPVPCDPNLIGASLAAQWWTLAPSGNACPLLPGVGTSNILGMSIAD
jgi:hypothetical protein